MAQSPARQTLSPFPVLSPVYQTVSSPVSVGTDDALPLSFPVETETDMPASPKNSKQGASGKGSLDPKKILHLAVSSSPCCGLGDVTGIESVTQYVHDSKIPTEYIFASLHAARARHYKEYDQYYENRRKHERLHSYRYYGTVIPKDMDEVRKVMALAYNYAKAEYKAFRAKNAPVGCYVFTIRSVHNERYGGVEKIVEFVKENKLGTTTVQEFYNPNSSNEVFIVTWAVEQNRWEELGREWLGKDY